MPRHKRQARGRERQHDQVRGPDGRVIGEATGIGLAIAKRLVEGGAQVVLTARTAEERRGLCAELGSAAQVVAPSGVTACLGPGGEIDLLFADVVPDNPGAHS
jgi:NAD(P)-dependent dehydrogenase (short-subunit alcohol dehydrogenase family)